MKIKIIPVIVVLFLISQPASGSVHLAPQLDSPSDITYVVGSTGNSIQWTAEAHESGDEPTVYIVTRNDTILEDHNETSWQDNVPINVSVDGLEFGTYAYEIEVRDTGYPQYSAAFDTVLVFVVEEGASTDATSDDLGGIQPLVFGTMMVVMIPLLRRRST